MNYDIVVISNKTDSAWLQTLRKAAQTLGQLRIVPENSIHGECATTSCDLVILDAPETSTDVATLIKQTQEICPHVPILVATTSPTWQRTRQAFRAGAYDYARKSLDVPTVIKSLQEILQATGGDGQ